VTSNEVIHPIEKLPSNHNPRGKVFAAKPKTLKDAGSGLSMTIQAPKATEIKVTSNHKIFFSADTKTPKRTQKESFSFHCNKDISGSVLRLKNNLSRIKFYKEMLTLSRSSLPGLKCGTDLLANSTAAPVFGFLPIRGAR
jgi:hypothetical protein